MDRCDFMNFKQEYINLMKALYISTGRPEYREVAELNTVKYLDIEL